MSETNNGGEVGYFEVDDTFTAQEMRLTKKKIDEVEHMIPQLILTLELKERLEDPSRPRGNKEKIPDGVNRQVKTYVTFLPNPDEKQTMSLARSLTTLGVLETLKKPSDFEKKGEAAPNLNLVDPKKEYFIGCNPTTDNTGKPVIWWNLKNYNLTSNSAPLTPEADKLWARNVLGNLKKAGDTLKAEQAKKQADRAAGIVTPAAAPVATTRIARAPQAQAPVQPQMAVVGAGVAAQDDQIPF